MKEFVPDPFRPGSVDQVKWSATEKRIARQIFDRTLQQELDAITQTVKDMALGIKTPSELWELEDYLTRSRKAIDAKYDFRYSRLPILFGQLIQNGQITVDDLHGLAEDKLGYVRLACEPWARKRE
jgi:hypothetical protein